MSRPSGTPPATVAAPLTGNFTWRADFTDAALGLHWSLLRRQERAWLGFSEGELELRAKAESLASPGQPAFVVLDPLPDQRFKAQVTKVGLLPDTQTRFGNPNLKVYNTEVLLQDTLPDVKPGVSARAEIVMPSSVA